MLEVIAMVCALDAPEKCKDVHLNFDADQMTGYQCLFYGQSELAKWTEDHPKWRIARWSCVPAGQVAKL